MTPEQSISPLTLSFREAEMERSYRQYDFPRMRQQGRMAILVGVSVYLLYGILDRWFVPAEAQTTVWVIRLTALLVPAAVFALTFHPMFQLINHVPLALVGLAAGIGLMGMLWQLPVETAVYYYVGLVLVTFYTYNFIGTRFIDALVVDMTLLVTYNVVFGVGRDFPLPIMVNHDFFIVSANLIGGFAGYMAEQHRRILFIHKQTLEQERRFHQQRALHDRLTDLPNRELLFDRIGQILAKTQRTPQLAAGIFIDLDDFKRINDTEGHACGDWVLQEVARRLVATLRETDTVSRLGGDEFFVLAPEVDSPAAAQAILEKLSARLLEPMQPPGVLHSLVVGASLGVCLFPFSGCSATAILQRADQAMYEHKRRHKATTAAQPTPGSPVSKAQSHTVAT